MGKSVEYGVESINSAEASSIYVVHIRVDNRYTLYYAVQI